MCCSVCVTLCLCVAHVYDVELQDFEIECIKVVVFTYTVMNIKVLEIIILKLNCDNSEVFIGFPLIPYMVMYAYN